MKATIEQLIKSFEHEHDKRRQESSTIHAFLHAEPPETLYHYTDAGGLKGIVEQAKLWFTNAAFFNDASELHYGLLQVEEALRTIRTDPAFVGTVKAIYGDIEAILDCYITCFCERGDLLNQWHGYADRGGGFSLGLCTADVAEIVLGTDVALCKVIYDHKDQVALIQAQVSAACEALNQVILSYEVTEEQLGQLTLHAHRAVLASLSITVAAMKDPVFRGEEEWRLVRYRHRLVGARKDVEFRISGQLTVPYIPTSICAEGRAILPIREIIIGPTVHSLAERSVKELLLRYDMWTINGRDVALKRSSIPLQHF